MGRMKPFQRASVLKALREIVVWYGVSPDYTRQEMANFLEITKNAGFIISLARFCQNPNMPDFSNAHNANRLDLNLRNLILAGRRMGAGREATASVASAAQSTSQRRSPPSASLCAESIATPSTSRLTARTARSPHDENTPEMTSPKSPPERPLESAVTAGVIPLRHTLSLGGISNKVRCFADDLQCYERERELVRERERLRSEARTSSGRSTSAAAPSTMRKRKEMAVPQRSSSVSPTLRAVGYDDFTSYPGIAHGLASTYANGYAAPMDRYEHTRASMNVIQNSNQVHVEERTRTPRRKGFMQGTVSSQGKEVCVFCGERCVVYICCD